MKIRTCFVSNSSSSSFIVFNASTVDGAKSMLAECIARFLDRKATHERHLQEAMDFIEDRIQLGKLAFFKNDGSRPGKELSEILWTDIPESILSEDNKGKMVMVDRDYDSIAGEFAESETWEEDEKMIIDILNRAGARTN
jgi:hypothetical protein